MIYHCVKWMDGLSSPRSMGATTGVAKPTTNTIDPSTIEMRIYLCSSRQKFCREWIAHRSYRLSDCHQERSMMKMMIKQIIDYAKGRLSEKEAMDLCVALIINPEDLELLES